MADKLHTARARLTASLQGHYDRLRVLAPGIPERLLTPKPAESDVVLLPSKIPSEQRLKYDLSELAGLELDIRIGHAHDVIDEVRTALAVRVAMQKESQENNGYDRTSRAKASVRRAEGTVKEWQAIYQVSWQALMDLGVDPKDERLAGLQPLENDDLVVLGNWLEGQQYKDKSVRLPWIWAVRPLAVAGGDVSATVQAWNEEGSFVPASYLYQVAYDFTRCSRSAGVGACKGGDEALDRRVPPPQGGDAQSTGVLFEGC